MDPTKKQQPTAAAASRPAAEATKPTTLLDAYEVECIRREMERLLLGQNADDGGAEGASSDALADQTQGRSRRHLDHHRSSKKITSGAKNANPAPEPALAPRAKKGSGGGARLQGRHAVAICSGAVTVASAGAGATGRSRRRRGGYREVEKV